MKKLVIAICFASCVAFAADAPKADAKPADANPAVGWKPKKVTKKDTKGIEAFYKETQAMWMKGDVEGLAAMHDFPVFMLTDNAAGITSGGEWTKDMFMQAMKPALENMPKDAKIKTTTKPSFVTDSIAFVEENHTMTIGKGKPESWTSASILVLKDGKWMVKGGSEGGWGDMMPAPAEKKAEAAPADKGTKTADAKQPAAAPAAAPAKK